MPTARRRVCRRLRRGAAPARATPASTASSPTRPGRDWWPLALVWAVDGQVPPARPRSVARPTDAAEVAAVLAVCTEARRARSPPPAGAAACAAPASRSSAGSSLDLHRPGRASSTSTTASLLVDVRAGTFGDTFEDDLRPTHGLTLGHWPQSIDLSTVGGWLACRGAGQYSTRYGKIEDMVVGLEVALADGRLIRTGGTAPRPRPAPT